MKEVILTPEGYEKLKHEIDLLRGDKRREVAERIRVAREFGDIAENAEYDDAKNEQAMLEHPQGGREKLARAGRRQHQCSTQAQAKLQHLAAIHDLVLHVQFT